MNRFKYAIKISLVYFIFFSIHIVTLPSYLTPRIICLILIVLSFIVKHLTKPFSILKSDVNWIGFNLFQLIYTGLLVILFSVPLGSTTDLNPTFNFLISCAILPFIFVSFFDNAEEFCTCIEVAVDIQSIIVLLSFLFPSVRNWLEAIQTFDMSRYDFRIIGLGVAGAGGSVYLCSGVICVAFLLIFYQFRIRRFISLVLILIATALVGRTGFYVAILIVLYLILSKLFNFETRSISRFLRIPLIFVFILVIANYIKSLEIVNSDLLTYTYNRLFEILRDNSTIRALVNDFKLIPGISFQTLIGTGINRGFSSSGLYFWSDSGYIKRYASIGLVFAFISYVTFIKYIFEQIKTVEISKRRYLVFTLILLLIIEYKEPFIYMLSYPLTLIMLSKLSKK